MIFFLFLCWGVWEVPGIYSRYLDMWDNVIRAMVYIIRVSSCEMIYLILFVGWVCLWAWYIFSFRMRVRMVPTDRIIRIM